MNWGLLAITWAPETRGSRSRALNCSLESNQTLSHNLGSLSGRRRHKRKTKKSKTFPHPDGTHRKPRTQVSKGLVHYKLQDFTRLSRVRIALSMFSRRVIAIHARRQWETHAFSAMLFAFFWFQTKKKTKPDQKDQKVLQTKRFCFFLVPLMLFLVPDMLEGELRAL